MIVYLQALEAWYLGLTRQERYLIAFAALLLPVVAFESLWWAPTRNQAARAAAQIESLTAEQAGLEAEVAELERREALDPDAALRVQLETLEERISELDRLLEGQTLQVLTPEQMPAVLRDLIAGVDGLEIVGMRSRAPERMVQSVDGSLPILYRHALDIDLAGDYLALLRCVQSLEALPWRLYWGELDLRADGGAPSEIRLQVFTLSLREAWIRV